MRKRTSLAATLGVVACGMLGLTKFATAGSIDAVSGASVLILGGTTTGSTASIQWKYIKYAGKGNLVISLTGGATKSIAVPSSARTKEATSASYTITGLSPSTSYGYSIKITDGGHSASSGKGTFITDKASASIVTTSPSASRTEATNVDPLGRRHQNRGPIQINQFGTQIELNEGHR